MRALTSANPNNRQHGNAKAFFDGIPNTVGMRLQSLRQRRQPHQQWRGETNQPEAGQPTAQQVADHDTESWWRDE